MISVMEARFLKRVVIVWLGDGLGNTLKVKFSLGK